METNQNNGPMSNGMGIPQQVPTSVYVQQMRAETIEAQQRKRAEAEKLKHAEAVRIFGLIGLPSFVYAIIYTFCLYNNYEGITFPLFAVASIAMVGLMYKRLRQQKIEKKGNRFYAAALVILGILKFTSANGLLQIFDMLAFFFIMCAFLIHNFYPGDEWSAIVSFIEKIFDLISGTISRFFYPASDMIHFGKEKLSEIKNKSNHKTKIFTEAMIGLAIAVPLLCVVIILLSSADAVFGKVIKKILMGGITYTPIYFYNTISVIFMTLFVFWTGYCLFSFLDRPKAEGKKKDRQIGSSVIAITVTSLLTFVYLVFCLIQISYVITGNMELPRGYTYAEYAHEGYNQLLFLSAMNLVIVLAAEYCFRKHRILNAVLSVFCACTYIMMMSCVARMMMYIETYALTMTRLLVLWSVIVLAVSLTIILLHIFIPEINVFRSCFVAVIGLYLVFAGIHPDYWIASYNISMMQDEIPQELIANADNQYRNAYKIYLYVKKETKEDENFRDDFSYLMDLSEDAVPAIMKDPALSGYYRFYRYEMNDYTYEDYFSNDYDYRDDYDYIDNYDYDDDFDYSDVHDYSDEQIEKSFLEKARTFNVSKTIAAELLK